MSYIRPFSPRCCWTLERPPVLASLQFRSIQAVADSQAKHRCDNSDTEDEISKHMSVNDGHLLTHHEARF
jgi:hypothetical protein